MFSGENLKLAGSLFLFIEALYMQRRYTIKDRPSEFFGIAYHRTLKVSPQDPHSTFL
jgi:hypothetical protein